MREQGGDWAGQCDWAERDYRAFEWESSGWLALSIPSTAFVDTNMSQSGDHFVST